MAVYSPFLLGRTISSSFLKTVHCGKCFAPSLIRQRHTVFSDEDQLIVGDGAKQQHPSQPRQLEMEPAQPAVSPLSSSVLMPPNVEEMQAAEKAQFSPRRTRDTSSARIAALGSLYGSASPRSEGIRDSLYNVSSSPVDRHIDVYDCNDTVALESLVQTNVPKPFGLNGQAPTQFNSPDCHGAQDDKYVSGDLQNHHQSTHNPSKKNSVE